MHALSPSSVSTKSWESKLQASNTSPLNIHHKASRNKVILLHNHDALLTPKNIHNHSIIYLTISWYSNFFPFFPKCLFLFLALDISSLTKDWTQTTKVKALSTNCWTAREFSPKMPFTAGVHVVQLLSHVWFFAIPWTAAAQASLSFTISWSLLKLVPNESMMPSNPLILCCPLLLLPPTFPRTRVQTCDSRSNQILSTAFVRCSL